PMADRDPNTPPSLDLTKERAEPVESLAEDRPYDPAPEREQTRTRLAYGLVVLLGATILLPIISTSIAGLSAADAKTVIQVSAPPLIGVTGAVLGFYFGGRS